MERAVAIKKLTKLLGKNLYWRIRANAPTREEREAAQAALPAARAERQALKEKREARRLALLDDPEYKQLVAADDAAYERCEKLRSLSWSYKIAVGHNVGLGFHVKAEGDSWEEVIDKLQQKNNVTA